MEPARKTTPDTEPAAAAASELLAARARRGDAQAFEDLLLKLDGKILSPMLDVGTLTPGQPVTLQVRRGEELLDLEITPRAPQREITPF